MLWILLSCEQPVPTWTRGKPNPVEPHPEPEDVVKAADGSMVQCPPIYGGPGQRWYTYQDNACMHGDSTSEIEELPEEGNGVTCPLRWKAKVGAAATQGFSGVSTELGISNVGTYAKVVLLVRGNGRKIRARFPMLKQLTNAEMNPDGCSSADYDMYGQEFACGDGSERWVEVAVDLGTLTQQGWGRAWPLERTDFYMMQLQSADSNPGTFQCDFRILRLER